MHAAAPALVNDWDLPSLAWHEAQLASLCPTCDLGEEPLPEVVENALLGLDFASPHLAH